MQLNPAARTLALFCALSLATPIAAAQDASPESERVAAPGAEPAPALPAPTPSAPSARPMMRPRDLMARRYVAVERRTQEPGPVREPIHWFRGQLAAAYLAPLAAFGVIALTAEKDNILVPALVGLAGLSVPPLVHTVNDDKNGGAASLAGMVGGAAVGALTGVAISHVGPSSSARDRARDAAIFGVCGYTIWALLDISYFAWAHPDRHLWAASLAPSTSMDARGRPRVDGVQLRVAGKL